MVTDQELALIDRAVKGGGLVKRVDCEPDEVPHIEALSAPDRRVFEEMDGDVFLLTEFGWSLYHREPTSD
jgi:hypothetical protein